MRCFHQFFSVWAVEKKTNFLLVKYRLFFLNLPFEKEIIIKILKKKFLKNRNSRWLVKLSDEFVRYLILANQPVKLTLSLFRKSICITYQSPSELWSVDQIFTFFSCIVEWLSTNAWDFIQKSQQFVVSRYLVGIL